LVAAAKGIKLPENCIEETIEKLMLSPQEATSSMHRDFLASKQTELASLTEYVVLEGLKYNVPTPTYKMIFDKLRQ
jgi:ketopantoate reductase